SASRHLDISNSTIYSRSTASGAGGWSYLGSNHTLIAGNSNIYIASYTYFGASAHPFQGNSNHQYHNIWFTYTAGNDVRLDGPIYADTVHFAGGNGEIRGNNTIGVATFTGTGSLFNTQTIGTLTFLDNGTMNGS